LARWNAIKTDDAGEFFDEIDGALEVEAVAGDEPVAFVLVGGLFGEAELFEDGVDFVARDVGRAEELARAIFIERDFADERGGFASDENDIFSGATGDGEDQLGGELGTALHLLRIDAALEAVAAVAAEAEAA
jgi:hypothetical protein